jgi:ParB-like chromosome segregation protein Spo0J
MPNRINQASDSSRHERPMQPDEPGAEPISTERYPIATVRINSLVLADSPRLSGEDPEHTRTLAETHEELPPIVVHRPTMRVVDGMHRIQAALLNGRDAIEARLLDCDEDTAFVLAVKANITHGLPLSQLDRKAAAARIINTHPYWSDRAVAAATGLSDKTISRIRSCSTSEIPQSNTRLGRDGRRRPVSTESRRREAAAIISARPDAGLREVARATGLSPATVRDVRQRIDRAEDPVPQRYRGAVDVDANGDADTDARLVRRTVSRPRPLNGQVDPRPLLAKLRNDPSLRFNDAGRRTLRWLHQHMVDADSWEGHSVPDHCAPVVADLARMCALSWTTLAEQLEQRVQNSSSVATRKAE